MRAIIRWRTRMLVFLSLLVVIITFQSCFVPQPEFMVSELTQLSPTEYHDRLVLNQPDIMEYNNSNIPPPKQELPDEGNLFGFNSFVSQLPRIQHTFSRETEEQAVLRESRQQSVKDGFKHAWKGYKTYAMGHDELKPVSNQAHDPFGGWGATIADALSTMQIMELYVEFDEAVDTIVRTNFSVSSNNDISTFETIIRYLGGFLSAYELSGDRRLLDKAEEVGQVVIKAFDTKFGLPYHRWNIEKQISYKTWVSFAEVASVQLEFATLSRHTGDKIYANKAQQIIDYISSLGKEEGVHIPFLFPYTMDIATGKFTSASSSFGAMGDSAFEYFLKQYLLVDGEQPQYSRLYKKSIEGMKKYMIRQTDKANLLFIHAFDTRNKIISGTMDHLSCFVPGMLAIGSRIFEDPEDLVVAEGLLETCVHMYLTSNTGLSPETWTFKNGNPWDPATYKRYNDWSQGNAEIQNRIDLAAAIKNLDGAVKEQVGDILDRAVESLNERKTPPRLSGIYTGDGSYLLRPETVESLFVLYRVTGNPKYQEYGWKIWQAIEKYCKTDSAYTAVKNVNFDISDLHPKAITSIHKDSMESFFFAETLKYLYLLFSSPETISLDKYVFNTEAHPFLRRNNNYDTEVLSSPRA